MTRRAPQSSATKIVATAAIVAFSLALGAIAGCTGDSDAAPAVDSTLVVPASDFSTSGFGLFEFVTRDGNRLTVKYYRATQFNEQSSPIWFVMHGASRAVDRYINVAAPVAERHNALALSIYFPKSMYASSSAYTLGVVTSGKPDANALAQGRWKDPDYYLYGELERVFDAVRTAINGEQHGYYIFGHSAGAQFTHRLLTFLPENRVLGAVAANAGWYTMPTSSEASQHTMPYGLRNSPVDEAMRRSLSNAPLTVLVGERDTKTPAESRMVPGTPEAMTQGKNRVERGRHYYQAGQAASEQLGTAFNWNFAVVPRAGHSAGQMIGSAAHFLFGSHTTLCEPTEASAARGLRITEILADPPLGQIGDVNNDAIRDSVADEFIELKNFGQEPICLSGWSIGDARKTERHVFPLGTTLDSQQVIVVFGGGQPTGDFGNALVQWAAFDGKLSLTNEGDVLTLRDINNSIVDRISWGNCAGQACADNHYPESLNISRSIVRSPMTDQIWHPYSGAKTIRFTPGHSDSGHDKAGTMTSHSDE